MVRHNSDVHICQIDGEQITFISIHRRPIMNCDRFHLPFSVWLRPALTQNILSIDRHSIDRAQTNRHRRQFVPIHCSRIHRVDWSSTNAVWWPDSKGRPISMSATSLECRAPSPNAPTDFPNCAPISVDLRMALCTVRTFVSTFSPFRGTHMSSSFGYRNSDRNGMSRGYFPQRLCHRNWIQPINDGIFYHCKTMSRLDVTAVLNACHRWSVCEEREKRNRLENDARFVWQQLKLFCSFECK